ncbi:MAG: substrate-binding domain-containing protein [Kiritimatiellae bacterium]|nr:substrate-binding domain-containing protein [Kiritimatiellia bacterium]
MLRYQSSSKVHKVLLSPKLEGKAGREHLAGILGFLDAGHVWDVQILRSASELTPAAIRNALASGTEGFLLSVAAARRQKPILDMLARSGRPVVILDDHGPGRSASSFAYIRFDTTAIVKAALSHFAENIPGTGVAFVPDPSHEEWSKAREAAFLSLAGKMRLGGSVFGGRTRSQLADWLSALPTPTGVLAANDLTALIVVETCAERGIEVPGRLAVLGIDNDELICGHARPPIATVEPNFSGAGFLAAATLERMMDGRKTPHSIVVTDSVNRIVLRDSARPRANSSHLFCRAMDLIEKDSVRLDVMSLARALGISRSLLADTFKREGRSVGREIKNARYEKVFELLRNPNQAIGPIANLCGWRSETHLMHDFKKRMGMTMRAWRRRHLHGNG